MHSPRLLFKQFFTANQHITAKTLNKQKGGIRLLDNPPIFFHAKNIFQADSSSLTDTAILKSAVSTKNPVAYTPIVIIISGIVGTYSFT